MRPTPGNRSRILAVVKRIPRGRVASYGQVATLAGLPGHAREVGRVMRTLPDGSRIPWHRVVNAQGRISSRSDPVGEYLQRQLLEAEGVRFRSARTIALDRYRWEPRTG